MRMTLDEVDISIYVGSAAGKLAQKSFTSASPNEVISYVENGFWKVMEGLKFKCFEAKSKGLKAVVIFEKIDPREVSDNIHPDPKEILAGISYVVYLVLKEVLYRDIDLVKLPDGGLQMTMPI